MYTTKEKFELMNLWEQEITDIAVRGNGLVPKDEDMPRLRALGDMIYDLSAGANELVFNKKKQPEIMVNLPLTGRAYLSHLSAGGKFYDVKGLAKPNITTMHPAFIVNGKPIKCIQMGKYPNVEVGGTNYQCSLYGLPPAWGGDQSYDGLAKANDTVNAGAYAEGVKLHNITRAEWCYIANIAALEGFQARGANSYGSDGDAPSEHGAPCGYIYDNGNVAHVLTGSGPLSWRHDGTPFGIWGLNGPTYNIVHGYCTVAGELRIMPNNNAAAATFAELNTSNTKSYRAILADGSLVDPLTPDTLKYDYKADPGESGEKPFEIATSLVNQQVNSNPYGGSSTSAIAGRGGMELPLIAKVLLLAGWKTGTPRGNTYMRNGAGMVRIAGAGALFSTSRSGGGGLFHGSNYYPTYADSILSGRSASYKTT